jgi:hypothetical protein
MTDIAALSLSVDSSQVKQAVATLNTLTPAASAAERAAQKWGLATDAASRSADDFSKRVQRTIADLQFQQQQLARTSTEQERYTALRRAGVSAASAEGQAITASVRALQAQKAALGDNATAVEKFRTGWEKVRGVLEVIGVIALADRLIEMGKSAFEAAAGLDELAQQNGVSARALQGMQFAAVQAGVGLDNLSVGLTKFSGNIGKAADGNKEMIDSLNSLGVKILDASGKLRPNEAILTDLAKAITGIEDPARRTAAEMDFFGKSGAKLETMLGTLAQGYDAAAQEAEKFHAMIGPDVIERLDKQADAFDRNKLVMRAFFAEAIAGGLDWLDRQKAAFDQASLDANKWLKSVAASFSSWLTDTLEPWADGIALGAVRASAMFIEAWKQLPSALGNLFTDGMNAAIAAVEKGLNWITGKIAAAAPWLGVTGGDITISRLPGGGGSQNPMADISGAGDRAVAAALAERQAAQNEVRQAAAEQARIAAMGADLINGSVPRSANGNVSAPSGASNPAAKTSGETPEDKYKALEKQLLNTKAAQDAMTAAAAQGEQAFEAQKASVDAQNKVLEIFKTQLADTDPRLTRIRDLMVSIAQGKVAEAFSVATTELQKQNVILEAQIRLRNEAPEVQAREIALIKAQQEAEKGGTAITAEAIDARRQAIEQNETLKQQQDDLNKAQELWTTPLKQGLANIQTSAADAFESILDSGNISFQSLGDAFVKTIKRMAAEFLALATVRPVLSVLVQGLGDMGLVSPATQRAMGFGGEGGGISGGGGSSIFGGSSGGGGGLGSIFGSGGLGGFLSQPIMPGSYDSIDQFLSGGGTPAGLGGTTWGQGLGALGGAASGIYQLASGGGSTSSTISGIGSLVGAAASFIPGIGPILGPIIGLASGLFGGLFGGAPAKPPVTPTVMTGGGFSYSGGHYTSGGGMDTSSIAATVQSLFDMTRASIVEGKVYGAQIGHGTNNQYDDKKPYFNADLMDPNGGSTRIITGNTELNAQQVGDYVAAKVFQATALNGGLTGLSPTLLKALQGNNNSVDEVKTNITNSQAFDDLVKGDNLTNAEKALRSIDDSFSSIDSWAKQLGIDTTALDAAKQKQIDQVGEDFQHTINAALDPVGTAMADFVKQREADARELAYINDNIKDVTIDAAKFQQYEALQESNLKKQLYGDAVSTLQAAIDQMTTGNLANLSPTGQLNALQATYAATLAQSQAGDPTAIARLASDATNYTTSAQQSFTSGPQYQAILNQVRRDLGDIQASIDTPTPTPGALPDQTQATQAVLAANSNQAALIQQQSQQIAMLLDKITALTSQMQRIAVNR